MRQFSSRNLRRSIIVPETLQLTKFRIPVHPYLLVIIFYQLLLIRDSASNPSLETKFGKINVYDPVK